MSDLHQIEDDRFQKRQDRIPQRPHTDCRMPSDYARLHRLKARQRHATLWRERHATLWQSFKIKCMFPRKSTSWNARSWNSKTIRSQAKKVKEQKCQNCWNRRRPRQEETQTRGNPGKIAQQYQNKGKYQGWPIPNNPKMTTLKGHKISRNPELRLTTLTSDLVPPSPPI